MFVVGLTGGIGSGKTTVADQFQELGIDIVDADEIAREVVLPGSEALTAIAEHFGPQLINQQGGLKRSELRKLVFADAAQRRWLEELLHPLIRNLMIARIDQSKSPYCLLVSPLLIETSHSQLVSRILVVDVTPESQLHRTLARDGSDEKTIKAIMKSQSSRAEKDRQTLVG